MSNKKYLVIGVVLVIIAVIFLILSAVAAVTHSGGPELIEEQKKNET